MNLPLNIISIPKPILVTGKTGQLGNAFSKYLNNAIFLDKMDCDLSNPYISEVFDYYQPKTIINCAGYTAVDKAELEPRKCFNTNLNGVWRIANWASKNNATLVNYSTNYVYGGGDQEPIKDTSNVKPLNTYGYSKMMMDHIMDMAIMQKNVRFLIFRTSWVYNETGNNLPNSIIKYAKENHKINITYDQTGTPTYASDLALMTLHVLNKAHKMEEFPSGIYHLCNSEPTNLHEFATFILNQLHIKAEITPVTTEIYYKDKPKAAKRPLNTILSMDDFEATFGIKMPTWKDAIRRCYRINND